MTSYCVQCKQSGKYKKIKHRDCKKVTSLSKFTNDGQVEHVLNLHENYCRKCRRRMINYFHRECKMKIENLSNIVLENTRKPFSKKEWAKDMTKLPLHAFEDVYNEEVKNYVPKTSNE